VAVENASRDGRLMPEITRKREYLPARIALMDHFELLEALIRRTIVDDDNLVLITPLCRGMRDAAIQRRNIFFFVIDRNNDRDHGLSRKLVIMWRQ
jgi:hypothetical protein